MKSIESAIRVKTSSGLQIILTSDIREAKRLLHCNDFATAAYNHNVLEMQKRNCGFCIIDELHGDPVDNEFELEEVYKMLEEKELKEIVDEGRNLVARHAIIPEFAALLQ